MDWSTTFLQYSFAIEHIPGAKMSLVDYISRNLFANAKKTS